MKKEKNQNRLGKREKLMGGKGQHGWSNEKWGEERSMLRIQMDSRGNLIVCLFKIIKQI